MDVKDWLNEIDHAKRREKDFRKNGETILDIYNAKKSDQIPFNILYSNTETLSPALYSQTPRPVVKRRFTTDESSLTRAVERSGTRILEYMLDTDVEDYEDFDDSMKDAVLDGLLPGRGVTQVKFDAIFEGEDDEKVKWATICTESRKWNQVHFGFAKKWKKVPWVAFEDYLDEDECKELFDKETVKTIKFSENEDDDETDRKGEKSSNKTALIYQIWVKADKEVIWITPQSDEVLKKQDDPLEISGFFNIPKPLMFHKKSNNLLPTALYTLYENQAKELNRLTRRLNRVIEAIKVRGAYDGNLGNEFEKIMDEDDNALIPTDKGAALYEGGFDKAIWMMPVEKLVGVAQTLYDAREQCKRVIYEITGISDVIRGMSKASETLGAQKIKESWGSMRIKDHQKAVQRYARDTLRMMLDIASSKIPVRLWRSMTGLPYPMNEERELARTQLQQYQAQAQQAQAAGQQPPPINPNIQQIAQSPSWEEILEVLGDDFLRSYKVDIETNSTLDAEATEDQAQVAEFMNAMAQFMNGVMPMVREKALPFNAAKSMFLEIARRFRFGSDVEEQIKKMEEPKGLSQEQLKKQADDLKKKAQQLQQQEQQFNQQKTKAEAELSKKVNDINNKEMELKHQKQMFEKEIEHEKQMAQKTIQVEKIAAKNDLKTITDEHKRQVQSMLDKHVAMLRQ